MEGRNQRLFDVLTPKTSFLLGIGTAVLAAGTIGFLALGGLLLSGGLSVGGSPRAQAAALPAPGVPAPAPAAPPTDVRVRPVTDQDHIRGDKGAPVTVVEYSDLECPFCKRVNPTMQRIVQEYAGKVRWVYRHFPLDSLHAKARREAEATECAAELGGNEAFWKYLDRVFEVTPSNDGLDPARLPEIAAEIGLDKAKFQSCLDSGRYAKHVQEDYVDATAAGGNGTPYNVIIDAQGNTIPVSGAVPFETFKQFLDAALSG